MFDKLKSVEQRFEDVSTLLSDPSVVADQEQFKKLMKEHKNLTPVVEKFREYCTVKQNGDMAKEMLEEAGLDKELKDLAEEEMLECKQKSEELWEELKILL